MEDQSKIKTSSSFKQLGSFTPCGSANKLPVNGFKELSSIKTLNKIRVNELQQIYCPPSNLQSSSSAILHPQRRYSKPEHHSSTFQSLQKLENEVKMLSTSPIQHQDNLQNCLKPLLEQRTLTSNFLKFKSPIQPAIQSQRSKTEQQDNKKHLSTEITSTQIGELVSHEQQQQYLQSPAQLNRQGKQNVRPNHQIILDTKTPTDQLKAFQNKKPFQNTEATNSPQQKTHPFNNINCLGRYSLGYLAQIMGQGQGSKEISSPTNSAQMILSSNQNTPEIKGIAVNACSPSHSKSLFQSQKSPIITPKNRLFKAQQLNTERVAATSNISQFYFPVIRSSLNSFNHSESTYDTQCQQIQTCNQKDQILVLENIIKSNQPSKKVLQLEREKADLRQQLLQEKQIKNLAISLLHQLINDQEIEQKSEKAKKIFNSILEMQANYSPQQCLSKYSSQATSPSRANSIYHSDVSQSVNNKQLKNNAKQNKDNHSELSDQTTLGFLLDKTGSTQNSPLQNDLNQYQKITLENFNQDKAFSMSPLKQGNDILNLCSFSKLNENDNDNSSNQNTCQISFHKTNGDPSKNSLSNSILLQSEDNFIIEDSIQSDSGESNQIINTDIFASLQLLKQRIVNLLSEEKRKQGNKSVHTCQKQNNCEDVSAY